MFTETVYSSLLGIPHKTIITDKELVLLLIKKVDLSNLIKFDVLVGCITDMENDMLFKTWWYNGSDRHNLSDLHFVFLLNTGHHH